MRISSTSEHTEKSKVTSVDIIYSNSLNILHSVETYLDGEKIASYNHRTACKSEDLGCVRFDIPAWLSNLVIDLPREEVPPAEGDYIIQSTEILTINIGSSIIWLQKSALSYSDGEIRQSSRHENQPLELLYSRRTGVLTWEGHIEVDERATAIIKIIPPEVLGFAL